MERQWHSALPLLLAAAGIIAGAATSNPFLLMGALIAATVGVGSMSGAFFQLPPLFLSGSMVAVGIAAINATGNLGGFVGPYVFGILQDSTGSSLTGYVLLAALLVVGAGVILLPMFRRTDTPRSVPASAIVVADPASAEVALAGLEPPVSDGR
jgi:ACS family tartrate transporter-like MFS transporter